MVMGNVIARREFAAVGNLIVPALCHIVAKPAMQFVLHVPDKIGAKNAECESRGNAVALRQRVNAARRYIDQARVGAVVGNDLRLFDVVGSKTIKSELRRRGSWRTSDRVPGKSPVRMRKQAVQKPIRVCTG